MKQNRCLGMVGGLGVGAAVHYYVELCRACPGIDLVMIHADMHRVLPFVQANDPRGMAEYFAGIIGRMKSAGAEIAVLPAVTPHMCIGELREISPLPLIGILEPAAQEVRRRGIRRAVIFGTRMTIESRMFGALEGVELLRPSPEELDYIHKSYFQLASTGQGGQEIYEGLTSLAHEFCNRGAEAVLLAGTDFAVTFNDGNIRFPYVNCAGAHVKAILDEIANVGARP